MQHYFRVSIIYLLAAAIVPTSALPLTTGEQFLRNLGFPSTLPVELDLQVRLGKVATLDLCPMVALL